MGEMRVTAQGVSHHRRTRLLGAALTVALACAAAAPAARADERVSVTFFLVPESSLSAHELARVSHALSRALRKNPRLRLQDSDKLLAEFAGDMPRSQVKRARAAHQRGVDLLRAKRSAAAVKHLGKAVAALTEVLPFIKKQELARALLALGVALADARDRRSARKVFENLATWRPSFPYDRVAFPVRYARLFARARETVAKRKKGSVELMTSPTGAKAYVDGRFTGVTPTVVWGLTVGEHFATFKKAGFIKAARVIVVNPREQRRWSQELRRSAKFLLVKQSLAAAVKGLGEPKANEAMADLGRVLFVHQLMFVRVQAKGTNDLEATGYLYDMRSRLRLNQVHLTFERPKLASMNQLAGMLYLNVRYDGSLQAPADPTPPPARRKTPLYTRWWLWTAVGVGAAAAATAVVLPLALREHTCSAVEGCVSISN